MKKLNLLILAGAIITATLLIAYQSDNIPKGWFKAGSNPGGYQFGIENTNSESGNSCAFIKSDDADAKKFGTLMQTIKADNYLGKRIRLSGYIKAEKISGWAGMWMRIDGSSREQLGFDNMVNRAITGSNDWTKYEIVLDVPQNSATLNFGVLLHAEGNVMFDNFKLEEVDKSVPVTNLRKANKYSATPVNLGFDE